MSSSQAPVRSDHAIAAAFVAARKSAGHIATYPGPLPQDLSTAYGIQDQSIALWQEDIVGWKVGGINGHWVTKFGTNRLIGPVFARNRHQDNGLTREMPVFARGFAAFEGEVTAVLGYDVPAGQTTFTTQDALDLIGSLNLGVEIASSPFPEINEHGPLVTITDFGNNNGLILGEEIPDWTSLDLASWTFETLINGVSVGKSVPTGLPGGPLESVRFALENTSRRGFSLAKGTCILTGAVTGVHQGQVGDEAVFLCKGTAPVRCRLVAARGA